MWQSREQSLEPEGAGGVRGRHEHSPRTGGPKVAVRETTELASPEPRVAGADHGRSVIVIRAIARQNAIQVYRYSVSLSDALRPAAS